MTSLLPPNASALERAAESAINTAALSTPVPLADLWNPWRCPLALLPWLAWALSVDEWDAGWSEDQKRGAIAASVSVHRLKGTIGSVRRALAAAGYGDAVVVEGVNAIQYDGSANYDGSEVYGGLSNEWAVYRVYLSRPITIAQGEQVRRMLAAIAPARSHLAGLYYQQALNLYNGAIAYDGTWSHGVA